MNPTNDPVARMETDRRLLRAERRALRRRTEEERAARWERIMQLLDFLFKTIPTLTGAPKTLAYSLQADAMADLEFMLEPIEAVPTDQDYLEADKELETA
jgi:hypothetical protein